MLYDLKGNEIESSGTVFCEIGEANREWMVQYIKKMLEPSPLLDMLPIIHKENGKDMYERTVRMQYGDKSGKLTSRRPVKFEVEK